ESGESRESGESGESGEFREFRQFREFGESTGIRGTRGGDAETLGIRQRKPDSVTSAEEVQRSNLSERSKGRWRIAGGVRWRPRDQPRCRPARKSYPSPVRGGGR